MISKWLWVFRQFTGMLWVRAALFALLGVVSALAAILFKHLVPFDLPGKIGAEAVDNILNILAASMLAVTTFSLSVMVSALGAATSHVTPRATKLLAHDSTTQNVLATFLGTFLFSLVGIITLSTGAYGETGRVILFAVTLFVVAVVVVTMVRWIDYLTDFGLVTETTSRVEHAAAKALTARAQHPFLGGSPLIEVPDAYRQHSVGPDSVGYVQHVDMGRLSEIAEDRGVDLFLAALPGSFVHPGSPLVLLSEAPDDSTADGIRSAWTIEATRSFDQDPRFGLIVLAEVASRALSPGVNDPGTAIDIIGRLVRLLIEYGAIEPVDEAPKYPRVHVPELSLSDLFEDSFGQIARYGAGGFAVSMRLQKAFAALTGDGRSCDGRERQALLRDGAGVDAQDRYAAGRPPGAEGDGRSSLKLRARQQS